MIINRIAFKNCLGHHDAEFTLGPVTLIAGPNGSGKSSILDAAELVRYGTCRGLPRNAAGSFARDPSKPWSVEIEDELGAVKRTKTQCTLKEAELEDRYGDKRVLEAVFHAQRFLDMKEADRVALLNDLTQADMSELVEKVADEAVADTELLLAVERGDLRRAFRMATESRRAEARLVEELRSQDSDPRMNPRFQDPIALKGGQVFIWDLDPGKIREALQKLREREEYLRREAAWASTYRDLQQRAQEAQEEIDRIGNKASFSKPYQIKLEEAEEAIKQAEKIQSTAQAGIDQRSRQVKTLEVVLKAKGKAAKCPACTQPIEEARSELRALVKSLEGQMGDLNREHLEATQARDEALTQRSELLTRRAQAESYGHRLAALRPIVQKAADANPPESSDEELAQAAQECHGSQEAARYALELRSAFDEAQQAFGTAKERLDKAKLALAAWERVCELVDPGKAEVAEQTIQSFALAVEGMSPLLFGGEAGVIKVNPETLSLTYRGLRWELVSNSEQERCRLLVAAALSSIAGLKLLVVDDAERFDPRNRGALMTFAKKAVEAGHLDQVIVAAVAVGQKPSKTPDWITRIDLEAA